ncbi:hypothetical protein [Nocardioides terrigena]|uniref:hypothetical protein n=1 Tax=Nocardioides terrigena TaxID=424797 RepID=UPI00131EED3E|nr:hypothetical protein [Nocardioides terrigena]
MATATAVLALVLTGCSDSGEPAEGSGDAGASASSTPSESATETASTSPSEAPETPEVAPATGRVLKVKGMRVHAPEGWETTMRVAVGHGSFPPGQVGTTAGVTRFPNSGLFTIEEIADEEVADLGRGGKRLDDLEIDGTQVYHLVWTDEKGVEVERFATIAADQRVALEFTFANGESRAEKDEIIQSMLATMQLG